MSGEKKQEVGYKSVRDENTFKLDKIESVSKNTSAILGMIEKWAPRFFEMAQVKTDFDMLFFGACHEGHSPKDFPASSNHYLCKQFRGALFELDRIDTELEELSRKIAWLEDSESAYHNKIVEDFLHPDLEVRKLKNYKLQLAMDFFNRAARCVRYEQLIEALIKHNDGKEFTNEQFQTEQTRYYQWFFEKEMCNDRLSKGLQVGKGVIDQHNRALAEPLVEYMGKQIESVIQIIDHGDGSSYEFGLRNDKVFGNGAHPNQLRPLSKEEKLALEEKKKMLQNPMYRQLGIQQIPAHQK